MSFGQWKPTITLKYQPFPKQACIHKIINEPIDSNPQDVFPYALIFLSGIADSDRSSGGVELCKQKNSM